MQIRFEVSPLAPFVPCVDTDNRLAEEGMPLRTLDQRRQPRFVFGRRRPMDDKAGALAPGVIVPAWHRRLDQRKFRNGLVERIFRHVVETVDLAAESVVQTLHLLIDIGDLLGDLMWRKFDGPVHAVDARVVFIEALTHHDDGMLAEPVCKRMSPACDRLGSVRYQARPVDHQQRPALQAEIAGISEMPCVVVEQCLFVLAEVVLRDENFALHAVPSSGPIFIGPHQAERHVDVPSPQELLQRFLQKSFAIEPVIVEEKPVDAGRPCEHSLLAHDFHMIERIKAEIAWNTRLVMILESWNTARNVGPLGKPGAPPFIVVRKRVELSEVVGQYLGPWPGAWRKRTKLLEMSARFSEALDLRRDSRFILRCAYVKPPLVPVLEIVTQRILVRYSFE